MRRLRALRILMYLYMVFFLVYYLFSDQTFEEFISIELIALVIVIFDKLRYDMIIRKRKRIEEKSREEARSDSRGFFLVLRSFTQTKSYETRGGYLDYEYKVPATGTTILSDLDKAISAIGRLVVIGEVEFDGPGESWTAIMVRTDDDNWRRAFRHLASLCRAIILIPADTAGSMEEIGAIQCERLWRKTIVFMPPLFHSPNIVRYNTYDNVHEQIKGEKQEAWNSLRSRVAKQGIKLPLYETNGCFYLPNQDLSVREKVVFSSDATDRVEQIRQAFEKILSPADFSGKPIKDIFDMLERLESEQL